MEKKPSQTLHKIKTTKIVSWLKLTISLVGNVTFKTATTTNMYRNDLDRSRPIDLRNKYRYVQFQKGKRLNIEDFKNRNSHFIIKHQEIEKNVEDQYFPIGEDSNYRI